MTIDNWRAVKNELLSDTSQMELIGSDNVTVCRFHIEEKSALPAHSHTNEQITIVLEGKMVIKYGNEKRELAKGDACCIPSNVIHSAEITEVPFKSIDIFNPARQDFLNKLN